MNGADLLRFLCKPEEWMQHAQCRNADPALFILEVGKPSAPAKKMCSVCPVIEDCRDYQKRTGSVGVWAGEVHSTPVAPVQIQDARPRPVDPDAPPSKRREHAYEDLLANNKIAARKQLPTG